MRKTNFTRRASVWLWTFLSILLFTTQSFAQNQQTSKRKITGKVASVSENLPVPGASIFIKGTRIGTVTDANGGFSINAKTGDVLLISSIGFQKRELEVGESNTVDVKLDDDVSTLSNVVVVGYGAMKRSDLTGSVVSVTEAALKKTVATSFDQMLQGRAAGVEVTQNSGQPGGSVSVRIRGINSINSSNEPLYVIDGIQISGSANSNSNPLTTISPSDIVSIEILKDASASAIYGAQGANGVVLITTRRGKVGQTKISYEGYYASQNLPIKIDVLNLREYAQFSNERGAITGVGKREEYLDPSLLGEGTNWQKELFRSAPMQNHQFSISSSTEKTQYVLSAGYFTQDGIAKGSNFDRFNVRLNLDNQVTKWMKMGVSLYTSQSKENVTVSEGSLINLAITQAPDVPAYMPDGSFGGPFDSNFPVSNPIALALLNQNQNKNTYVSGNFYSDIYINKDLTFRNEFGGNFGMSKNYFFTPTYVLGVITNLVNTSSRSSNNNSSWLIKNYLTYKHTFGGKNDISFMAGHEAQNSQYENLLGSRTGFFSNDIRDLNAGDPLTAKNGGGSGSSAIESYFTRLNYTYNERYMFTATYRADGSSNFGPNSRWGYFPSFAGAWRISNEKFFKNISEISNLKLRLGWGQVGNQNIGSYAYGATMGVVSSGLGLGALTGRIANPDVQWEATESTNLGLDLGLFKNKIEFVVDVYKKITNNLLMQPTYPTYVGTDTWTGEGGVITPWLNIGAIQNTGIELTLNTVNIDKGEFTWRSGFMLTFNKNKITKLANETPMYDYQGTSIITQTVVGQPVGQFYGYVADGIFTKASDFYQNDKNGKPLMDANGNPVPVALPTAQTISPASIWVGDYKWKDLNSDGVIDAKDRAVIGDPAPKFYYSINNNFSYKNFDLSIFLNGSYGGKIYNLTRNLNDDPMSRFGMIREVSNYARIGLIDPAGSSTDINNVIITNPGTSIVRITKENMNDNQRISSRFIEDGSYLRVKTVSLGYNIPAKFLSKVKLSSLRLYITGQNLFTFTKYKGYDPEIGAQRQKMTLSAIDNGRYPSQRIYTFGLNVSL